jgi:flagellar protein FliO/FliZ
MTIEAAITPASSLSCAKPQMADRAPASLPWGSAQFPQALSRGGAYLLRFFVRVAAAARQIQVRQNKKRLRVCETVPLGDKRFVAVIQVDDQQFLLGGSSNSINLLAQLEKPNDFANILSARVAEANRQA